MGVSDLQIRRALVSSEDLRGVETADENDSGHTADIVAIPLLACFVRELDVAHLRGVFVFPLELGPVQLDRSVFLKKSEIRQRWLFRAKNQQR